MKRIAIVLIFSTTIFALSSNSTSAQVSVGISISANIPPPALPVYVQPACPTDGFLWVPGYWAYGDDGYFWVPGVWVRPPQYGFLWTPAYWGYAGGVYGFHYGYWGPHIGFYGGINYGYGYSGSGFYGGRWEGNSFRYNTAVVNVNTTVIHNTYVDRTVIVNHTTSRVSFNGGAGGVSARPSAQEETAMRERHVQATPEQTSHLQTAMHDRSQFASVNHGQPATVAMNKPGGTRYDPHGNVPVAHPVNSHPAPQHQQAVNNHPAPQHQQAASHPVPQQHQQAYHPAPQQQHMNHPQPHNPAPQQHAAQPQHGGEPAHPKEH
jgi:WXXGXW repeat (2 copies)